MLDITAEELYNKYEKLGNVDVIPAEFDYFVGKKYAFKIDITKFNLEKNSSVFPISKLTTDESIISELVKKSTGQNATETDSITINVSDYGSQDGKSYKDAVSFTGDNSTPLNATSSTADSPATVEKKKGKGRSDEMNLKRNLDTIYDLEDTTKSSSSKSNKKSPQESTKIALLVPKLEK